MINLLADLKDERKKYGPTMTKNECVELVNAVLWKNKDAGYAIVRKAGSGQRYDGAQCSADGIVFKKDRTFIDVLGDAGNVSKPSWQVHALDKINPKTSKLHNPYKGPVVEAIVPRGEAPPVVVPPVVTPPPAAPDTELRRRVEVLEKYIVQQADELDLDFKGILARLTTLELAEYEVVDASTSRDGYLPPHSHRLSANVTRKVKQ